MFDKYHWNEDIEFEKKKRKGKSPSIKEILTSTEWLNFPLIYYSGSDQINKGFLISKTTEHILNDAFLNYKKGIYAISINLFEDRVDKIIPVNEELFTKTLHSFLLTKKVQGKLYKIVGDEDKWHQNLLLKLKEIRNVYNSLKGSANIILNNLYLEAYTLLFGNDKKYITESINDKTIINLLNDNTTIFEKILLTLLAGKRKLKLSIPSQFEIYYKIGSKFSKCSFDVLSKLIYPVDNQKQNLNLLLNTKNISSNDLSNTIRDFYLLKSMDYFFPFVFSLDKNHFDVKEFLKEPQRRIGIFINLINKISDEVFPSENNLYFYYYECMEKIQSDLENKYHFIFRKSNYCETVNSIYNYLLGFPLEENIENEIKISFSSKELKEIANILSKLQFRISEEKIESVFKELISFYSKFYLITKEPNNIEILNHFLFCCVGIVAPGKEGVEGIKFGVNFLLLLLKLSLKHKKDLNLVLRILKESSNEIIEKILEDDLIDLKDFGLFLLCSQYLPEEYKNVWKYYETGWGTVFEKTCFLPVLKIWLTQKYPFAKVFLLINSLCSLEINENQHIIIRKIAELFLSSLNPNIDEIADILSAINFFVFNNINFDDKNRKLDFLHRNLWLIKKTINYIIKSKTTLNYDILINIFSIAWEVYRIGEEKNNLELKNWAEKLMEFFSRKVNEKKLIVSNAYQVENGLILLIIDLSNGKYQIFEKIIEAIFNRCFFYKDLALIKNGGLWYKRFPKVFNFFQNFLKKSELLQRIFEHFRKVGLILSINEKETFCKKIEKWLNPEIGSYDTKLKLPGSIKDQIENLIAFKKLAGEGDSLPKEIKKILNFKETVKKEYLSLLEKKEITKNDEKRIGNLEILIKDESKIEKKIIELLRKTLTKSLNLEKMNVLEKIAEDTIQEHWRRIFPETSIPLNDSDWDNALELYTHIRLNKRILKKLLKEVLRSNKFPFKDHPKNKAFLETLKKNGVSLDPIWDEFNLSFKIMDENWNVRIETNPLKILKIGTVFGTCLKPAGGLGYNAVAIAAEVNKQVLVCYDDKGNWIGRKIILLDKDGYLYGLTTYGKLNSLWMKIVFDIACLGIAKKTGLVLCTKERCLEKDESGNFNLFAEYSIDAFENFDWWILDFSRGASKKKILKSLIPNLQNNKLSSENLRCILFMDKDFLKISNDIPKKILTELFLNTIQKYSLSNELKNYAKKLMDKK